MYIHSAALMITSRCNLACSYCFEQSKPSRSMPIDVAKRAVDWLLSPKISGPEENVEITFFGGEPLLEFKCIQKLVPYARSAAANVRKNISFTITTNGTLFTKDVSKFWSDNNLGILLSCDGIEEAHNTHRKTIGGRGSFVEIKKNMGDILAISRSKEVRMTVTPETVHLLSESVLYLKELGFHFIAVYHAENVQWSDSAIMRFQDEVYEIAEGWCIATEKNDLYSVLPLEKFIRSILFKQDLSNDFLCGAGRGYVAIAVDGTIFPCHQFASAHGFSGAFPLGDIYSGFNNASRLSFLRASRRNLLGCDIDCFDCNLRGCCMGGCLAANYGATGNMLLRPATARFHELIWHDVASSIVSHFQGNESKNFNTKFCLNVAESTPKIVKKEISSCANP